MTYPRVEKNSCPTCGGWGYQGDGGGGRGPDCTDCKGTGARHERTPAIDAKNPHNPKDIVGGDKLPLHLLPTPALAEVSLAFLEGALKYGVANWRKAGVKASIYRAAGQRHGDKWWNGEDRDAATRVHHLASRIACDLITLDAMLCGKLVDDRPPAVAASTHIDGLADAVRHLKDMFKHYAPKHYTVQDTEVHDKQGAPSCTSAKPREPSPQS